MAVVSQGDVVTSNPARARPPEEWRQRADNSPLARVLTGVVVLGPIAAITVAAVQLWQRAVSPIDIALLAGMYLCVAMGVTIGYHRYLG